jgi:multiple sugar transport system substrate-binding protein
MFKNKRLYLCLFLLITLILTGAGCTKGVSPEVRKASRPITLNWWSPFLESEDVTPLIEAYRAIHPNVTINFRRIRYEDYKKELLNALAEDRGPDIFSLHNTWLREWKTKLVPMPKTVTLPYQEVRGGFKKEVVTVLRTTPTLGIKGIKNNFVSVVENDAILSSDDPTEANQIYGLPLSVDTLALYYNRDLLNLAGIPGPPTTWAEFREMVKKLTKFDQEGKLVQSGAALGTARNIERAADILALLMMQNGAEMINEREQVAFDKIPAGLKERGVPPGEEALIFYTDFANPTKEVYTWNEEMPNSLQAFAAGKTAFFFGYSYHLPLLRNLAPRLNFAVTAMPQVDPEKPINFANYWLETVSKKTKSIDFAWDFIQFATSYNQVKNYLERAKKPTALRALVVQQAEDLDLGPFVSQVLTARSWYQGKDAQAAEEAFLEMIEQVNKGEVEPKNALRLAAKKVEQTLR